MDQNRINITIAGKSYQLAGQESNEYLSKLAEYIEAKYQEFGKDMAFRSQPIDKQHLLLQINIADDYFKSKEQVSVYVRQNAEKDAEIRDLQQKLADLKVRYDNAQSDVKKLEKSNQTLKKRLLEYEKGAGKNPGSEKATDH
ncbi:MAG: cell division protein ZapA [Lachnospiraceae bacterium]|nr:cell division protein ZapA [Lachnospiraceae bacterium]